jgi:hypothetical protein
LWVTILWARPRVKQLALPERTSGRSGLTRRPAGRAPPSPRDPHLSKPTPPQEGRRSGRRPPASFTMAPIAPTLTPCRGADRGGSHRTRCRRRERRKRRSQVLSCGACSHCLSGVAEPRTFTCPSSPAGATVQPRLSRRPGGQPPSKQRCVLPPTGRQTKAEQLLCWRARSEQPLSRARNAQPPSRACRAARPRNLRCAPRCEFSTLDFLS